jgi:hypothetical protein
MSSQVDDMFKLLQLVESHQMAKRNNPETIARNFMDDDSYVGLDGHEYLYGDDVGDRRREVYERAKSRCEMCGKYTSWVDGEMHHKTPGLMGAKRPDDLDLLVWACQACHRYEHRDRNPQFTGGGRNGTNHSEE